MQHRLLSSHLQWPVIFICLAVVFGLVGCVPQLTTSTPSTSAGGTAVVTAAPTTVPLTERITRAQIEAHTGWEDLRAQDYTPDTDVINAITAQAPDIEVLVFLGTWCSDTKRELPRFFKIMDQAGISETQVTLIGLDRSKKDAAGLTAEWQIEYVPTFIFIRNGRELGRIIETPDGTLEGNIARILASQSGTHF